MSALCGGIEFTLQGWMVQQSNYHKILGIGLDFGFWPIHLGWAILFDSVRFWVDNIIEIRTQEPVVLSFNLNVGLH
jgi:hypothetical protein